ncbi:sulfite exporter TauE/SafE family protein [Pseudonocardia hydrocarbonoxydans]|uniref:sulfite exporter TauE/SafE family protein n=1 Tax=Pseudonocardia hydrocarbonoxydans TaxID=76726 RepID=UPI001C3F8913|nr:sulfite exporter TauE/SafE family protein [Pseudonocardia hydrocarbonoxydans]
MTVAAGLAIGLLMGVLGGGGGVLTVPALVYLLGSTPQQATTGSLVIVGVAALAGTVARARSGGVRWRTGTAFGALGVPAALAGTAVNQWIDPTVLLLAFAALVLVVAGFLLAGCRRSPAAALAPGARPAVDEPVGPSPVAAALVVVPAGLAVGFLTGLLGVGGGFLVVPALVLGLRMPMTAAVGTSLLAISINSGASLAARAGVAEFDWPVLVPFTLAAVCATVAGRRVAGRFSGDTLTTAFAVLLIGVAALVTAQSVLAA